MQQWNILVTRALPGNALDKLKQFANVTINTKDRPLSRKELLAMAKGKHAVLSLLTDKMDKEFMDKNPQLKAIANYAVGFDNIDVAYATQKRIPVLNTPGVLSEAVAEHTIALLFAIARRIPESDRFMRAGKYKSWAPELELGAQVSGKTLGIIGTGRIGFLVAQKARMLGMKVLYNDVKRNDDLEKQLEAEYATVEDVLKESDFISIHVPLLPTTRHLIDAKKIALMKKTAYVINTSRGPIIDEKELVKALKAKRIAGAALDVFEFEPALAPGLAKLENVVLTPHTASATFEARSAMADLAVDGLLALMNGQKPANIVNKELFP